jgi:hypothetical protein
MASLSEPIARQANKEDGCTSRFYSLPSLGQLKQLNFFQKDLWEGRFKSQACFYDKKA